MYNKNIFGYNVSRKGAVIFKCVVHGAIGISTLFMLDQQLNTFHYLTWIGVWIGSYLPDSDHQYAWAGHLIPMHKWFKHRRETHSLYMAAVFSSFCAVINLKFGLGILIGYLMHLAADRLTYMGHKTGLTHLMWPYHIKKGA